MNQLAKKRIYIFLLIVFILSITMGTILFLINGQSIITENSSTSLMLNSPVMIAGFLFMFFPTIAVFFTMKLTKEKVKDFKIKPKFKNNERYYLYACFLPGILVVLGTTFYFILFPSNLDLNLSLLNNLLPNNQTVNLTLNIKSLILIALGTIFLSPLVFVNHILALGEEFGWRGYLLPKMYKIMSLRKAILLNGVLWGILHAPLIYFGLHYGTEYPLFPIGGILTMTLFTTTVGVFLSYLTVRTNSVIPASIAHGTINAIKGLPLILTVSGANPLIGPSPAGIIGGMGFTVFAFYLYKKVKL